MEIVNQLWLLKQVYVNNGGYYDNDENAHLHHIPPSITEHDLQELEKCGHAPNNIVRIDHDAIIRELKSRASTWSIPQAAEVFVASLWSAPMLWRSALTGKLIANVIPEHLPTFYSDKNNTCRICGLEHGKTKDLSLEWYSRMTSGTPLDGDPAGHVYAFREMEKQKTSPSPNEYDRWVFRAVLTVLRRLPPKTRYSGAIGTLKKENLLPLKTYTYGSLLETLALIGVLDTREYPGMAIEYTTYIKRDERPNTRVEVQAPLAWWDSSIGINEEVLGIVFSNFDCSNVSLSERPEPIPPVEETIKGSLERKRLPVERVKKTMSAGKGSAQAGDVYAVRVREGVWVTVYCHKVVGPRTRVEYMDGVFDKMPEESGLILKFKPRQDGRWQSDVASIDSTSWVKRIARNISLPETDLPDPDRIPLGGAKDLKHLAHWCFDEL